MIVASIPLWILAAFLFLMGCTAISEIVKSEASHPTTYIRTVLFIVCWIASSAAGYAAAWMAAQ